MILDNLIINIMQLTIIIIIAYNVNIDYNVNITYM